LIEHGSCLGGEIRTLYQVEFDNVDRVAGYLEAIDDGIGIRARTIAESFQSPWISLDDVPAGGNIWSTGPVDRTLQLELTAPAGTRTGSVRIRFEGDYAWGITGPRPRADGDDEIAARPVRRVFEILPNCAPPAPAADPNTLYVNAAALPNGDGTSWDKALRYLRDALDEAKTRNDDDALEDVDEIRVAGGCYRTLDSDRFLVFPGNRAQTFALLPGVTLLGGYYPGTENRDAEENPSILTGDLDGNDEKTGDIAAFDSDRADNSLHVLNMTALDRTAVLDGFTVEGGHATSGFGGGMNLRGASPTIRNCRFRRNFAGVNGGAVAIIGAPLLESCRFEDNFAMQGAGIAVGFDATGIWTQIIGCTFVANDASSLGGGVYCEPLSRTSLNGCRILGNSDGVYAGGASELAEIRLTRCVFSGNAGTGVNLSQAVSADVEHCTFSRNGLGGLVAIGRFADHASVDVLNCIFWGNKNAAGDRNQFAQIVQGTSATVRIDFSLVAAFDRRSSDLFFSDPDDMLGNNPLFVDDDGADDVVGTDDDDLSLDPASPATGAGEFGADMGAG